MSKLFQVYEDDLAELEQVLPQLGEALSFSRPPTPKLRTQLRRVQKIISDVRWNYGPPLEVEKIDGSDI